MYNPEKPYKKEILESIRRTWKSSFVSSVRVHKPYIIFKKKFFGFEVDHTDGIGTKGIFHWQKRTFKNAVLDSLAMNLNDLLMVGATPYKLQNCIMLPREDKKAISSIIKHLGNECAERRIVITGGETAIHDDSRGLEIIIFMTGAIRHRRSNLIRKDDALVGLKSNGLHSNGFSLVRKYFSNGYRPEFTRSTRVYSDVLLKLIDKFDIHGMMHITGGAFTKLKDIMASNIDAIIQRNHPLKPQKIFYELYKRGVSDKSMYRSLNNGIGFVVSLGKSDVKDFCKKSGGHVIGEVVSGSGKVIIDSMYSDKKVIL